MLLNNNNNFYETNIDIISPLRKAFAANQPASMQYIAAASNTHMRVDKMQKIAGDIFYMLND